MSAPHAMWIAAAGLAGLLVSAVPAGAASAIEADWLFQAQGKPLLERATEEIGWTEEMAQRMSRANAGVKGRQLDVELAALRQLKTAVLAAAASAGQDAGKAAELYLAVRKVKRTLMFKHTEVDFDRVLCVDVPYTRGDHWQNEDRYHSGWNHQSRYHSAMCAAPGGRLVVLDGLSPDARIEELMPGTNGPAAFFRPDLSFDGQRVLFCMLPEKDKSYHLYEIGLDGARLRQVTQGNYSDMDPVYLPDGNFMFVSTRANVYAQCGPWAPQHVLTRCDRDGKHLYILDAGSEPDWTPAVMENGTVLYTRWEYIDKPVQALQRLWVTHPDGTMQNIFWGNQSATPSLMAEGRPIPGTGKVMFTGMGHHDIYDGSIGILDPSKGMNYPQGLVRVTMDVPWTESGSPPHETPAAADYHGAGQFEAYKSAYPLSEELFLVSARRTGHIKPATKPGDPEHAKYIASIPQRPYRLYLMDIHGNQELIYEGTHNILYAQPVRPRQPPPQLADAADWPGSEKDHPVVRPGVLMSADIFAGAKQEGELRKRAKYLRVIEALPKTYSTGILTTGGGLFGTEDNSAWGQDIHPKKLVSGASGMAGDGGIMSGPATTVMMALAIKRVLGTVPIAADGSVHFEVPPSRSIYFQLLDADYRLLHSMRSWTSVRPGEKRTCLGCHETQLRSPPAAEAARDKAAAKSGAAADTITPPPWGARSLSYLKDIQPLFDRYCAQCHQGKGAAVAKLDLTLRSSNRQGSRWARVFPEPYLTLLLGAPSGNDNSESPRIMASDLNGGKGTIAGIFRATPVHGVLEPMTTLSYTSKLINLLREGQHHHVQLPPKDLQMLMAWIDTWGMYRSEEDVRALEDPDPAFFTDWPYPPRLKTAPVVHREYSQDEYSTQEDRLIPPMRADRK